LACFYKMALFFRRTRQQVGSVRLYDIVPPAFLLFLTIIFFWRQLVLGQSLYWGDIGLYFLPMQRFLHDQLHQGLLPLWNPYVLCGAPYVGNPQTWPLYPSSLFLFILSPERAISAMVALHVWLAGWGMLAFLRRTTGLRLLPCQFAAVVFMFGGQLVSKEQFPNMVQAMAYVPWILLAVDRLVDRRDVRRTVSLGVVLGMQVLAAHAQVTMLSIYLGTAYGLLRLGRMALTYWRRTDVSAHQARTRLRREFGGLLLKLGGAGVIATGLSAGQVFPVLELLAHAWRQRLSFSVVNRFYLPPNQLLNFTLPTLHGHPYLGNFTARGNFWETCCYAGWIPVSTAVIAVWLGVVRKRRREATVDRAHPAPRLRLSHGDDDVEPVLPEEPAAPHPTGDRSHDAVLKVRFWAVVFVVGTWMSTGRWGHLYRGAYNVVPGFRTFHDPARCLLWASTAVAILAGYGLHALMRRIEGRGTVSFGRANVFAVFILMLTFVDLCGFGTTLYPLAPKSTIEASTPGGTVDLVRGDHGIQIGQARVIGPDSARSWERYTAHQSYRQSVSGYHTLWNDTLTPNLSMGTGLRDAYGYEPEARLDAQRVLGMIDSGYANAATPRQRSVSAALAGIYGVRYVVTQRVDLPESTIAGLSTVYSEPNLPPLRGPHTRGALTNPGNIHLSRNLAWQPRVRLTTNVLEVAGRFEAIRDYQAYFNGDDSIDIPHTTLVAGDPGFASSTAPVAGKVDIVDVSPDRVDVDAVNDKPCLLVLTDTLHPGWTATVDGRPEAIVSVDGFVRGISLKDAGRHVVRFIYRPATFAVGLYLSLVTLSMVLSFRVARSISSQRKQEMVQDA